MKGKRMGVLIVVMTIVFLLAGCAGSNPGTNPSDEGQGAEGLVVAVSILPQKTFVEKVAGDLVEVVAMIPPGSNPENYQVKPQDMVVFSKAALYFAVGVESEKAGLLEKAVDLNPAIKVVRQDRVVDSRYLPIDHEGFEMEAGEEEDHLEEEEPLEEDEHAHEGRDSHIWLSPKRAMVMVENIRDELSEFDPQHRGVYEENARLYLEELKALDQEISDELQNASSRFFLIYHPSMGYFAHDYGLEMVPIEFEGKEATAARLREVIDFARKEGIQVVFYQQEHDKNQAETIAAELGGRVMELAPLDPDYVGNLRRIKEIFIQVLK